MAEDILQDTLAQAAIFALIAIVFFLVVLQSTDLTQFYLRYYGKDTGTIVEATHAMKGELELSYQSIHPSHRYLYNFTEEGVYLTSPQNTSERINWRVRQQYGKARQLPVTLTFLEYPATINILKAENISFDTYRQRGNCPQAMDTLLKVETALKLESPPEIASTLETLEFIQDLQRNVGASTIIHLTIDQGQPGIAIGDEPSAKLGCLYKELLEQELGIPFTTTTTLSGVAVTITLPDTLTAPQRDALATKLALPLDTFLRS